jgi:hypothetical protein
MPLRIPLTDFCAAPGFLDASADAAPMAKGRIGTEAELRLLLLLAFADG